MVGIRQEHRRQFIKADLAVRLRILNLGEHLRQIHALIIRRVVMDGDRHREDVLVDEVERRTHQEAKTVHGRPEIT